MAKIANEVYIKNKPYKEIRQKRIWDDIDTSLNKKSIKLTYNKELDLYETVERKLNKKGSIIV